MPFLWYIHVSFFSLSHPFKIDKTKYNLALVKLRQNQFDVDQNLKNTMTFGIQIKYTNLNILESIKCLTCIPYKSLNSINNLTFYVKFL